MIRNSGESGVVDHSTPLYDVYKINNYVHICSINYINLMELIQ